MGVAIDGASQNKHQAGNRISASKRTCRPARAEWLCCFLLALSADVLPPELLPPEDLPLPPAIVSEYPVGGYGACVNKFELCEAGEEPSKIGSARARSEIGVASRDGGDVLRNARVLEEVGCCGGTGFGDEVSGGAEI